MGWSRFIWYLITRQTGKKDQENIGGDSGSSSTTDCWFNCTMVQYRTGASTDFCCLKPLETPRIVVAYPLFITDGL